MDNMENKKLALLRILQILWQRSSEEHPLMQEEIISILSTDYGISVDRKTVSRNVALLRDAGFEIESSRKGSYLSQRLIEDSELRLLIDSVLASSHISPRHSRDLIEKLCSLASRHFRRHVKNIYSVNDWNKSESSSLFYFIEIVDDAIEMGKQISFDYNKYGEDKRLHRSASHTVSPYQMILHNQRYYLMAFNERWSNMGFYRMDRISNMRILDAGATPLRSIKGYEGGINYKLLSSALPYMFTDTPEYITFIAEPWAIDQIIDWFGKDISIFKQDDKIFVRVLVSPNAMLYWAMQYAGAIEVVEPAAFRDKVIEMLDNALKKYKR